MSEGLRHLLPKSAQGRLTAEDRADMESERLARKEHRFVADVLKAYGWSAGRIASCSTQVERRHLNFYWLQDEQVTPHHFDWAEVKTYDIHRLFDAPTKTDVFARYLDRRKEFEKAFTSQWRDELIMPFSCRDMTGGYYAVHDSHWFRDRSRTFLDFSVRNSHYYIQTWKSVLQVIRDGLAS